MPSDQPASQPHFLLTIPEAAQSLRISRAMLYSLIAKRKGPPVVRIGRSVRISMASLQAWLQHYEHEQQGRSEGREA